MECAGVVQLYEHSVYMHNFCYNLFIDDGDSISYSAVDKLRPHEPMYNTEKSVCVNCNKILAPRRCAHALNENLNHCLKSAVGRSCAFGKSSKSESKQKS